MIDDDLAMLNGDLLPHEFTHSWNGKYRRPAGLATQNYGQPMKGDLLWVYEGLTQYLGDVLAARSGIWTPEQYRAYLAASAAEWITVLAARGAIWRIRLCLHRSSTRPAHSGITGGALVDYYLGRRTDLARCGYYHSKNVQRQEVTQ